MKTTSIVSLASAGFACGVQAQEFSLSLVGAPATVDSTNSASFTMALIGDASVGQYYNDAIFSLESNSPLISNIEWDFADWVAFRTDGDYLGNGNYAQVIAGSLWDCGAPPPWCQPPDEAIYGEPIGIFTVHLNAGVTGLISFDLIGAKPYTMSVFNYDTGELWDNRQGTLTLNGASIQVVPAAPTLALLGLAGIFSTAPAAMAMTTVGLHPPHTPGPINDPMNATS